MTRIINNFDTLQELIPELVIMLNPNLEILSLNHRFLELFPTIPLPKAGNTITNVFNLPSYSPLVDLFKKAVRKGKILTEIKIQTDGKAAKVIEFRSNKCSEGLICILKDNSEFNDMKEVLGRKILKYRNFIEMLPAMVCETNHKGMLTFASNMALDRFGYTESDIKKGLHLFSLLSDEDVHRAQKNLGVIQQGNKLAPREYMLKTKTGERFPASVQVEPIVDNGKTTGFRGKLEDLSEIKQIEKELKNAKDKAEHLSKTKSDFLANFSHEIKTPINAIIGLTNNLIKRISDPIQLSQLKTIRKSGNILLSLLNDILDLSKIEAGKLELYDEPVDMHELLMDISETFSYSIEEKGLIYYSNVGTEVPKYLLLDGIKLRQVLFNIVGNAVKFTDRGHISVNLNTIKRKNAYDLIISVEDSGYGIPKAQQRLIFKAFEQGEQLRKTEAGTGLGLAISKRIIQMMNGEIRLKSQLFKGSTFRINIPSIKKVDVGNVIQSDQQDRSTKYFPDLNILIVDDLYTNIETLEAYLLNYNCKTQSVQKVNDAFHTLDKPDLPNLVFMDIFMPEISGIEACRHIKNQARLKHIPIIAYSANIHHLKTNDKAVFDDFLPKPISESTLVEILEKYSNHSEQSLTIPNNTILGIDAKLREVIINQLSENWKNVNEYFINDDIKNFASQLLQIATEHEHLELIRYCKTLLAHINAFNISKIEIELKKLAEVFNQM